MGRRNRYETLGADFHWHWWVSRTEFRRWIGRILSEFPSEGNNTTVLDIGCGDGIIAAQLDARGFIVYGVETLQEPLEVSRQKVPAGIFTSEIPNQAFDYVLISDSLSEIGKDPALANVVRQCRNYTVVTVSDYEVSEYELMQMFRGCTVELTFEDSDHQLYIVEPCTS